MKKALLLALLLSPLPAAAQGGRPPAPAASVTAAFNYATPDGLISRRAGLLGEAESRAFRAVDVEFFLNKPFSRADLFAALRRALGPGPRR